MNSATVLLLIVLVSAGCALSNPATPPTTLEEDFDKIFSIFKRLNSGTKNNMLVHELITGVDCLMRRLYYNWPGPQVREGRNADLSDEKCTICVLWSHFIDLVDALKGALPNNTGPTSTTNATSTTVDG
ncbi:unnamed protein product [Hermetia illucens]|uniref:Uncharacterized protein n=2 Tax=Hermetia illucens TaxID=343691 RepID=A0A7R8YX95_HERIL|nr:unnamed protein product [Hermetia illucens]